MNRRQLLGSTLAAGAAAVAVRTARAQPAPVPAPAPPPPPVPVPAQPPVAAAGGYQPVVVPNGTTLPFRIVDGVKVFHLVAEPIRHEVAPGLVIDTWGYNGRTPGPLLELVEGDRARIYVTNKLPEATTVHWHGVLLPNGMDGVAGLTQRGIPPGATFKYEITFGKAGTFMYHPHFDEMTQIALGMIGMIVVHPRRRPASRRPVRDYALLAHEWKIVPGASRPDPLAMNDFNQLVFNGKAYPATAPLIAETGDLVRLRFGNLGPMDHHPIHLHGHTFQLVETDGGTVPPSARWPETTVLVPVGAVRVVELIADAPGDWPLHCHMTHHVMNQMGHDVPNMIGADVRGLDASLGRLAPGYMTMGQTGMGEMSSMGMPLPRNSISMVGGPGPFGTIDMGGMFTLLKIRDRLTGDGDPGWYAHPPGSVADVASAADLARAGIDV
ncbi:MAG TPA: copper oxidase [Kofleriaceae bacterium]|nr:copper oxidase [Kofleriaceae bacterium]